jgi:transcriptional regulator with XRE-family HTH domain
MSVSSKVKALMLMKGKSLADMAGYLGIREQSFRNKLTRESFTAPDLIRLTDALGARLQIDVDGKQMITLDASDLPQGEEAE